MGYLRKTKGFIAKKELFKLPCVKTWMKLLKCIPIDRENIRSSAKAISDAIKVLKTGHSMIIFPEGSRSKACEMGDFKAGSFKLATKSRLPIVPITVNGTYKILEKNNMIIKPTKIYLTIHKPVYTHDLTTEQLKELTEQVKDVIQRALHYKYKN
jgi:1-acyl-sn-glycerol-3-phosphate acyltransferase